MTKLINEKQMLILGQLSFGIAGTHAELNEISPVPVTWKEIKTLINKGYIEKKPKNKRVYFQITGKASLEFGFPILPSVPVISDSAYMYLEYFSHNNEEKIKDIAEDLCVSAALVSYHAVQFRNMVLTDADNNLTEIGLESLRRKSDYLDVLAMVKMSKIPQWDAAPGNQSTIFKDIVYTSGPSEETMKAWYGSETISKNEEPQWVRGEWPVEVFPVDPGLSGFNLKSSDFDTPEFEDTEETPAEIRANDVRALNLSQEYQQQAQDSEVYNAIVQKRGGFTPPTKPATINRKKMIYSSDIYAVGAAILMIAYVTFWMVQ